MKKTLILLMVSLLSTGCASMSGWQPTVDPYGDPNASRLQFDMNQCGQLASQASGTTQDTLMGAGAGALIGGAGGAALGAVIGDPAVGAALGAAALGIGGAAYSGTVSDEQYQLAYKQCLRNRGHRVL